MASAASSEERWRRDLGRHRRGRHRGRRRAATPRIRCCDPSNTANCWCSSSAKGRSPVAGGIFNKAFYVDDRKVGKPPESVLSFTCRRVDPLTGNCGRVPAGTVAHLFTVCKLFSGPNSYTHDARVFVTPIAADGTFVFDDVPAELHCCRLTLLMADGSTSALPLFPAVAGRELPPEVDGQRAGGRHAAADRSGGPSNCTCTDPTGGPARGA
jgi:hypothetical protein